MTLEKDTQQCDSKYCEKKYLCFLIFFILTQNLTDLTYKYIYIYILAGRPGVARRAKT